MVGATAIGKSFMQTARGTADNPVVALAATAAGAGAGLYVGHLIKKATPGDSKLVDAFPQGAAAYGAMALASKTSGPLATGLWAASLVLSTTTLG